MVLITGKDVELTSMERDSHETPIEDEEQTRTQTQRSGSYADDEDMRRLGKIQEFKVSRVDVVDKRGFAKLTLGR